MHDKMRKKHLHIMYDIRGTDMYENIIKINDFNDHELDVYARLSENQLLNRADPNNAMFIAESPKVIERAIDAGYEVVSFLLEDRTIDGESAGIIEKALKINENMRVFTAEFDVLTKLTGYKLTRGALACMKRKGLVDYRQLIRDKKRIAVLESVMNPTNVGAIIRSAAALGIEAVLLTPDSSDPFYRRAARVSMGTVFQLPWTYLPVSDSYCPLLKDEGFKTVSMALRSDTLSISDRRLREVDKLAILLGTEGEGLRQSTIDDSDYTVKIPMANGVDSLNVAACSAVAFWELTK